MTGGSLLEDGTLTAGKFTMSGDSVTEDGDGPGIVHVSMGLGTDHASTWSGGSISGLTQGQYKGQLQFEPGLTFGGHNVSTLGWDMHLGYGGSNSTSTYQAADTALALSNGAVLSVESGKLLLTEVSGGSTSDGRTINSASGTGNTSYIEVEGTLEDQVVGNSAGTKTFTLAPIHISTAGVLTLDGSANANPGATVSVPYNTAVGTSGYGVYQQGGNVNLGYGGTGTGTAALTVYKGFYQEGQGATINVYGYGAGLTGAAGSGNGVYINGTLKLDPTDSTSLWGNLVDSVGEVEFGENSIFDFAVDSNSANHSTFIVDGTLTVTTGATYAVRLEGNGNRNSWSQVINLTVGGGSWATGSGTFTNPNGYVGTKNAGGFDVAKS